MASAHYQAAAYGPVRACGQATRNRADLIALARALRARGIDMMLTPAFGAGTRTRLLTVGECRILWQVTDDPAARARAFGEGLDDVVGPWMDAEEALARILRRARQKAVPPPPPHMCCGDLTIYLADRAVERAGRPIPLLAREYDLLLYLARQQERPTSRSGLLKALWNLDFDPGTNRVEVHMSRLRAKLDRGFAWPMLRTVKGRGYALYPFAPD